MQAWERDNARVQAAYAELPVTQLCFVATRSPTSALWRTMRTRPRCCRPSVVALASAWWTRQFSGDGVAPRAAGLLITSHGNGFEVSSRATSTGAYFIPHEQGGSGLTAPSKDHIETGQALGSQGRQLQPFSRRGNGSSAAWRTSKRVRVQAQFW